MSFHIDLVRNIGSMKCRKTENYSFRDNVSKMNLHLNKYYAEKFSKTNGIEI